MNHSVRAKGIVGRALPSRLIVRDGKRVLRVDVTAWQQDLVMEVTRGLRRVEIEAYRHGVVDAADAIAKQKTDPIWSETQRELLQRAIDLLLDLHKRGPR